MAALTVASIATSSQRKGDEPAFGLRTLQGALGPLCPARTALVGLGVPL